MPSTLWYNKTACALSLYVRVLRWKRKRVQHSHPRRVHRYGVPSHVVYGVGISTAAAVAKRAAAVAAAKVVATVATPAFQTSPRSDVCRLGGLLFVHA